MSTPSEPTAPSMIDSAASSEASAAVPAAEGAWSPLRVPLYRALWLAGVGSNIGGMMQQAGAAWLMTSLSPSPLLVSLAQAAGTFPAFLLALPGGALADVVDRRKLMLLTQSWMLLVAGMMAFLAFGGGIKPWSLLALLALSAVGTALGTPAQQAVLGNLLPPREIPKAIVLGNTSLNIARAVGPLLAGVLIARLGAWSTFALNALSFLGVVGVLYSWKPVRREHGLPTERLVGAMAAAVRYLRHAPLLRTALVRGALFGGFASALWSLLPLVAKRELALDAVGYGGLLGALGVGALLGALGVPRLCSRIPPNRVVGGMSLVFAVSILALAMVRSVPVLCLFLVLGGTAWLTAFTTLAVAAGGSVPGWIKGRGLALYGFAFQGGMTAGSFVWGAFATEFGVTLALQTAGVGMALGVLAAFRWRIGRIVNVDLSPSGSRPAPETAWDPEPERGPVMVTVEYLVDPEQGPAFTAAMQEVRGQRHRDGAYFWGLFEDVTQSGRYVEFFMVESWVEHLRQHERLTVADRDAEEQAQAFHMCSQPPKVAHYVAHRGRSQGPHGPHTHGQGEEGSDGQP